MLINLLLSWGGSAIAQIRSDFILAQQGAAPGIEIGINGNLQVLWRHEGVYHAIFDSSLSRIRSPQKISDSQNTNFPRVTTEKNYVVAVWQVPLISFNSYIWGQLLTISGDTVSGNTRFNDIFRDAERSYPDVAFIDDTTFVVVWAGNGPQTGTSTGIYGQIATVANNKVGSNLLLSDVFGSDILQGGTRVVSDLSSGKFLVAWRDNRMGNNRVYGRVFFLDGTPVGSSFLISEDSNLTDMWFLSVELDKEGNFVVVWGGKKQDEWCIQLRRLLNDGTPLSASFQVNSDNNTVVPFSAVDVSFDFDGKSVVVWEQDENGHSKIFAQRFTLGGTPLSDNFRVSVLEDSSDQFFPDVELHNSKIYTLWGSEGSVHANIIDFDNPPVSVETPEPSLTKSFQLLQNYPNPFNATTKIKYKVPRRSHVLLVIYNLLGEEVITLLNEDMVPGTYEVTWNGKNSKGLDVPSGIYLYRLAGENSSVLRKMIVIR